MMGPMTEPLLTRAQAAERLGVNVRTLDRWAKDAQDPDCPRTKPRPLAPDPNRPGVFFPESEISAIEIKVVGS
jgi:hypothetical protein